MKKLTFLAIFFMFISLLQAKAYQPIRTYGYENNGVDIVSHYRLNGDGDGMQGDYITFSAELLQIQTRVSGLSNQRSFQAMSQRSFKAPNQTQQSSPFTTTQQANDAPPEPAASNQFITF